MALEAAADPRFVIEYPHDGAGPRFLTTHQLLLALRHRFVAGLTRDMQQQIEQLVDLREIVVGGMVASVTDSPRLDASAKFHSRWILCAVSNVPMRLGISGKGSAYDEFIAAGTLGTTAVNGSTRICRPIAGIEERPNDSASKDAAGATGSALMRNSKSVLPR